MSHIVVWPDLAGGTPVRRKLSQPEIIALRSLAKEPWRLPHQGFGFFWKFNKTWRRTWPEEARPGWAAVDALRELGLVEEHYPAPTVSVQMQLQLSARGHALLAAMNRPGTPAPVTYPAPTPMSAPRSGWLPALHSLARWLAPGRPTKEHSHAPR